MAKTVEELMNLIADNGIQMIDFKIVSAISPETTLLFKSLILGLQGIQEEYGEKYLRIVFQNS